MKKVLTVMLIAMFLMSMPCLADTTGRGDYTTPFPGLTDWLNNNPNFSHNHQYTDRYNDYERKNQYGLGLDVTLYEFSGAFSDWGMDSIEVQQKYDLNNQEYSMYGVCQVNLWRVVTKLLNK